MSVVIGKIIHDLVKKKGLKAKAVAEYVNVSESTLFGIYKRNSVDIDKLILFSRLLDKNLFLYYLNEEPLKSMLSNDMIALQHRIGILENDLMAKTEKIKDLQDITESQKKVIALHEANLNLKPSKPKAK